TLKKLIISEVISVILAIGIFLLVFSLLNGWEKAGKERYAAVVVATVAAFVVVAVGVLVAVDVAAFVTAVVGVLIAAVAIAVVAAVAGAFVATFVAECVAAVAGVFVVAAGIAVAWEVQKIKASEKVIWLSLGAEAVAIILPIILITLC
ncbi:MAG: hypothetical protein Q8N60_02240, partial [Candidatus Diapherotrites archaeon]|nr:hypothetical protein [Candidatus Diapherotrites archaeon]